MYCTHYTSLYTICFVGFLNTCYWIASKSKKVVNDVYVQRYTFRMNICNVFREVW